MVFFSKKKIIFKNNLLKVFNSMDYAFTENGLYSFKKGELFYKKVKNNNIIKIRV